MVHFTQYNRDELTRLVAAFLQTEISLASDEDNMFRLQFAGLVLSLFYNITRYSVSQNSEMSKLFY